LKKRSTPPSRFDPYFNPRFFFFEKTTQEGAWSKDFAKNLLITAGLFIIYLAIVIFLIPLL
jgi:hypothetical protein